MKKIGALVDIKLQLRLLEFAAWMHNFSKLSPQFVKDREKFRPWVDVSNEYVYHPGLIAAIAWIPEIDFGGALGRATLKDLIEKHVFRDANTSPLTVLMATCHDHASGTEKRSQQREEHGLVWDSDLREQPNSLPWYALTPFGYPIRIYGNAAEMEGLQRLAGDEAAKSLATLKNSKPEFGKLEKTLRLTIADSNLPVADVRISDMGYMVAALIKAAAVEAYLGEPSGYAPKETQWRLMRILADGPAFAARAVSMVDIVSRRTALKKDLDALRGFLEDELSFCNQVYEDEYGCVFIIPKCTEWDGELKAAANKFWRSRGVSGEISLQFEFSEFFGQGIQKGYSHQLGELLMRTPLEPSPGIAVITDSWAAVSEREVCTSCQTRPMASLGLAAERRICENCLKRRGPRVKQWLEESDTTIWLEELADRHGRIAVVSGRFRIERWLFHRGYLERTCFLTRFSGKDPRNIPPSSARVRRLLETANDFWLETEHEIRNALTGYQRIAILPQLAPPGVKKNHSYDLVRQDLGIRVSAIWDGERFIANYSEPWLKSQTSLEVFFAVGARFLVREPKGYRVDEKMEDPREFTVKEKSNWGTPFKPYLRLQLDSRAFVCIVPADKAVAVAALLDDRYRKQMSRVRNRLALDVNVIAGDSAQPLRAFLDASRRASSRRVRREWWKIESVVPESKIESAEGFPVTESTGSVHLRFANGRDWNVPVSYDIPTALVVNKKPCHGRTVTPDDYFPYFELRDKTIVHSVDLKADDEVSMEPSTFDFEFLDSVSRRFEIAYDPTTGKRRGLADPIEDRSHRPYEIGRIHELQALTRMLSERFATRQINILDGLLSAKQVEWRMRRCELDEPFIDAVIANLEPLPGCCGFDRRERIYLVQAASQGLLQDAIEIYLRLEKAHKEAES